MYGMLIIALTEISTPTAAINPSIALQEQGVYSPHSRCCPLRPYASPESRFDAYSQLPTSNGSSLYFPIDIFMDPLSPTNKRPPVVKSETPGLLHAAATWLAPILMVRQVLWSGSPSRLSRLTATMQLL